MVTMHFAVWITYQIQNINTLSTPQAYEDVVEQGMCANTNCPEE